MQESIDNEEMYDEQLDMFTFNKIELINFLNRYKTRVLDYATVVDDDYNIGAPNFSTEEWLHRYLTEDQELPW
jgi:hypothetical protein